VRLAEQQARRTVRALPTLNAGRVGISASRPTHEPAPEWMRAGQSWGKTSIKQRPPSAGAKTWRARDYSVFCAMVSDAALPEVTLNQRV